MVKKPTDIVPMQVRLRESLRVKLHEASTENAVSMNQEIVDRLEQTFEADKHNSSVTALIDALTRDPRNSQLLQMISATINSVDDLRADLKPSTEPHQVFFVEFARFAVGIIVDRFFALADADMQSEDDLEKMEPARRSAFRLANLILKRNGYSPIIDPESDAMMKGVSPLAALMGVEPQLSKVIK